MIIPRFSLFHHRFFFFFSGFLSFSKWFPLFVLSNFVLCAYSFIYLHFSLYWTINNIYLLEIGNRLKFILRLFCQCLSECASWMCVEVHLADCCHAGQEQELDINVFTFRESVCVCFLLFFLFFVSFFFSNHFLLRSFVYATMRVF